MDVREATAASLERGRCQGKASATRSTQCNPMMQPISLSLALCVISSHTLAFAPQTHRPLLRTTTLPATGYLDRRSYLLQTNKSRRPFQVPPSEEQPSFEESPTFSHASIDFFDIDQLTAKGPRANADVGTPHDATRPLVKDADSGASSGSWWCAAGGWPSPNQRATTEVFYVLEGFGALTDTDGQVHYFGPGDTVVLPKGWSGRWDVLQDIHKVWVVYDHPNIEETSDPIRAVVVPLSQMGSPHLQHSNAALAGITGGAPDTSQLTFYKVGPTQVGSWTCAPGSFQVKPLEATVAFHILEGTFDLVDATQQQHCTVGDTVFLPKGWSGEWRVSETVRKLWVAVE